MKKLLPFLLLTFFTTLPLHAQYEIGMSGLLNMASAEIPERGTFMGGGNFVPQQLMWKGFDYNTGNYFIDMTLFSFLELNCCWRLFKTSYQGQSPKFNQQDRAFSAKIRPWKEGKYYPAIAIGVNDPYKDKNMGHNYFSMMYGVATKSFSIKGEHRIALTAGYYYPLRKAEFLHTHDGICGGMKYTPGFCPEMAVIAEYDSQRFNVGVAARFWKHLSMHVFTSEFNCISAGLRYECTLIH